MKNYMYHHQILNSPENHLPTQDQKYGMKYQKQYENQTQEINSKMHTLNGNTQTPTLTQHTTHPVNISNLCNY